MPFLDYDGSGTKHEYVASVYTLNLYEQTFGGDLIKEVFGKIGQPDGDEVILDFTTDNWTSEMRAFWCMLKTADAIASAHGREHETVPPYDQWILDTTTLDIQKVSAAVVNECFRCYLPALKRLADGPSEEEREPEPEPEEAEA